MNGARASAAVTRGPRRGNRTVAAAALLAVEAGLALLVVFFHYAFTTEYGDVTDSTGAELRSGFVSGGGAVVLLLVGLPAVAALLMSLRMWMRLTAVAIPILMVAGLVAVTPLALGKKLEVQYTARPQCISDEGTGPGPGLRAERESQRVFDSIDHVGYFSGGGSSGVGGCDRSFVLTEPVDVLQHYRTALRDAGWHVVEDDAHHLRAQRAGMAFEVATCGPGGVVWAGRVHDASRARCEQQ